MNAKQMFQAEYNGGKNFMTPDVIEVKSLKRGRGAYELSRGEGFLSPWPLYGVTVVGVNRHGETLRLRNLSKSFSGRHSYQAARGYITWLIGRFAS